MPGTEEIAVKRSLTGILHVSVRFFPPWSSSSGPSARPPVLGTLLGLMEAQGGKKGKLLAQGEQGCEELEHVSGLLSSGLLCNLGDPFHA